MPSPAIPIRQRWWFAWLVATVGQFLAWCIADVFYVRFGARTHDSLLLVAPALAILTIALLLRPRADWLLMAVVLGIASTAAAVVLVLYLGIPFHFALGGSL
jgi:hypothetical protein